MPTPQISEQGGAPEPAIAEAESAAVESSSGTPSEKGDSDNITLDRKTLALLISGRTERQPSSDSDKKDFWDKLSSLSTFFSSVILAIVALVVTAMLEKSSREAEQAFLLAESDRKETAAAVERERSDVLQRQQRRTHELDVISKYLPYLTHEDEDKKSFALQMVSELASVKIAAMLATADPSPGKTAALEKIAATTEDEKEREAVVKALGTITSNRPSFILKNNLPVDVSFPEWESLLDLYSTVIEVTSRSTGRIELTGHDQMSWVGTAFVVSKSAVVMPRYVLKQFAVENSDGHWVYKRNFRGGRIEASIDFGEELDGPEYSFLLGDIKYVDKAELSLGLAIVEVIDLNRTKHPPLTLQLEPLNNARGNDVAIVGYPAQDRRHPGEVIQSVFGSVFEVKRIMPGRIIEVDSSEKSPLILHDSSSSGGTGGAPLLDFVSGKVIGVHVKSQSKKAGYAVGVWRLKGILDQLSK